ncbi:MAG TPA: hypothetical protein VFI41_05160 [Gemmatimonadales bacterium]|nr:hypothetical protein [Gemmatimonadales bacterium]
MANEVCVNCGQPATYRTMTQAANTDFYCEFHGKKSYPNGGLMRLDEEQPPATVLPPGSGQTDTSLIMRGGGEVEDSRLGRVVQFDERSRSFPMTELIAELEPAKAYKPRSHTWNCGVHLDQGQEGSCVGHAWAHELVAPPVVIEGIDHDFARWIYKTAQKYDQWAGEAYEGTSTLAGAKVCAGRPPKMAEGRGLIGEYRWIFGDMDELIKTLGYFGPVVLGTNWYAGMMNTDKDGFVRKTGSLMGGHCILIKGVTLTKKAVRLHQSWGESWGQGGDAWLSFADLEALLGEQGELCVPVHRKEWG